MSGATPLSAAAAAPPPPADLDQRAGIDQKLGSVIPTRLSFLDAHGRIVALDRLIRDKPTLVALGYFRCPNLCDSILHGMARAAGAMPLRPGEDYEVTFVSIDPHETPADANETAKMLAREQPAARTDRWHLLTGDQASIRALSDALGLRYFYDPRNKQYAHAAAIVVMAPRGRVAQYFFGAQYPPAALRLALVEASHGQLGSLIDRLVLLCCGYDPSTGRYSVLIGRVMQVLGVGFLALVGATFVFLHKRAAP